MRLDNQINIAIFQSQNLMKNKNVSSVFKAIAADCKNKRGKNCNKFEINLVKHLLIWFVLFRISISYPFTISIQNVKRWLTEMKLVCFKGITWKYSYKHIHTNKFIHIYWTTGSDKAHIHSNDVKKNRFINKCNQINEFMHLNII